MKGKDYL